MSKYLDDIDKSVIGMPFGEVDVRITRHRSKTTKIEFRKDSKIEPKSNETAFSDMETLINSMISAQMTGKAEFALVFKVGTIKMIVIKNKETKSYG